MDDIDLQVEAESPSDLSYQWYHNDKILVGQQCPTLSLVRVSLDLNGVYTCHIAIQDDPGCYVETNPAVVTVDMPTAEQLAKLSFDNEDIEVLLQPKLGFQHAKAAIGEKVHC